MPPQSVARLLDRLEELKRPSGAPGRKRLGAVLGRLARRRAEDAESLIRFHEALLFMRAYPQGAQLLRQTEKTLALIPDLARWSEDETRELISVIRAKAAADELRYARLLQRQTRLRRALIEIGSSKRR